MNCLVKGFPKLEVNWTRYGKLPDTTNKLTIKQVTFEDAGQYTCSAKNSEGKNEASFYFFSSSYSFHFLFFFLIEVKGGSHSYQREGVLVHNRNKCSIFFHYIFFHYWEVIFIIFFLTARMKKKRRFSFSESDLRTFKTHKEESIFRIQKLFLMKQWRHLKNEFKVTGRTNIISELRENVRMFS